MTISYIIRMILCGVVLLSAVVFGDSIANLGGANGTWEPFPGCGAAGACPTLTEGAQPGPYWDNQSEDGSHHGVGYFVVGQTVYSNSPNLPCPGVSCPQWVGIGNNAPMSMVFNSSTANAVKLLLRATANGIEFGYFNVANPSQRVILFSASDPMGSETTFESAFATYGFYIHYISSPGVVPPDYLTSVVADNTGTEIASLGPIHQHFAVFSGTGGVNSGNFIVGVEDHWGMGSNVVVAQGVTVNELVGDYQDLVVSVQAIPEPCTVGLMAFGSVALTAMRLRRRA